MVLVPRYSTVARGDLPGSRHPGVSTATSRTSICSTVVDVLRPLVLKFSIGLDRYLVLVQKYWRVLVLTISPKEQWYLEVCAKEYS